MDTNSDSPVTAMKWDEVNNPNGSIFLASFADGRVNIFDRRLEEDEAVVRSYSSHSSWVQKVKWHPTIPAQYISARFVMFITRP